jgi:hypothetical protein
MVDYMTDKNVQEAKERLIWDIKHIFDTKSYNPYLLDGEGGFTPKKRTGLEDFFHALVNLPVEYLRSKGFSHPQRWVKIPLYILALLLVIHLVS